MSLSPTGILPTGDTGKVHQCFKFIFPICSSHSLFTKLFTDSLNFRQIFCVECRMLSNSQLSLSKIRGFNSGVKSSHLFVFQRKPQLLRPACPLGHLAQVLRPTSQSWPRKAFPRSTGHRAGGPSWHVWVWQELWQPLLPPTTLASASSSA